MTNISKLAFFKAYSSLKEFKPKISGKQRNLSDELSSLKKLIFKETNPQHQKQLYKIAKHIHATRGSKQVCSLVRSFIYNLFHGRWGTSQSLYNQIKSVGQNNKLSDVSKSSSQTPVTPANLTLLHQLIQSLNKTSLEDIKDVVESEGYNWEEYIKWLKDNESESFSNIFQLALEGDKEDILPFLKNMNFQDLENECSDLNNPDNIQLNLEGKNIFLSKKLLSTFSSHFQSQFNGNFKDALATVIQLDDSYDDFKACLNLILFGNDLEISENNISNYLAIAGYYGIAEVKEQCEKWILQNIKNFDIKGLYDLASEYNLSKKVVEGLNGFVHRKVQKALMKSKWDKKLQKNLSDLAPFVTAIDLEGLDLKKKNLAFLSMFPNLESLNLYLTQNTDITGVASLKSLQKLCLFQTEISDADLVHLANLQSLQNLNLGRTKITDAGLVHLANLKSLKYLGLVRTKITDEGLIHLANLHSLQNLSLKGTKITDAGLSYLANLQSLQILNLEGTKITDAGLVHLANLQLLQLSLEGTNITGAGLVHLANMQSLQDLNLMRTKITDAGLAHLANLKSLQYIGLSRTNITDVGLAHLTNLQSLQLLPLVGTKITDAGLSYLANLKSLQKLILQRTNITDVGLAHLANLKSLQNLDLTETKITGAGLVHVGKLQSLQELSLYGTNITDDGLSHLANLQSLQNLYLHETKITDKGLAHVGILKSLQSLGLFRTKITDKGLAHVENLKRLQSLGLSGTEITDAGLVHVGNLKSLQVLNLQETKITDAGLVYLANLKSLQFLGLDSTDITDAGLVHLANLQALRTLQLGDTSVTDAGKAQLDHIKDLRITLFIDYNDTH